MNPDIAQRESRASELLHLVSQAAWANRVWIEFVCAQADREARPRELLAHIVLGECVWFERVAGEPKTRETFLVMDKEELLRRLDENQQTYRSLIASRLDEVIEFRRASGEEWHARVADVIHHLITHGYHHRGQLAAHYARKGATYPSTDHIDYLIQNQL